MPNDLPPSFVEDLPSSFVPDDEPAPPRQRAAPQNPYFGTTTTPIMALRQDATPEDEMMQEAARTPIAPGGHRQPGAYRQTPEETQRIQAAINRWPVDPSGGTGQDIGSLTNVGLLAGGEVLPMAAASVNNPLVRRALLGASTAVNGYFTWQLAHGAGSDVNEAFTAYRQGEYDKMAAKLGYAGLQGLLSFLGLRNLAKTAVIAQPMEAYEYQQASRPASERGIQPEPEVLRGGGLGTGAEAPAQPQAAEAPPIDVPPAAPPPRPPRGKKPKRAAEPIVTPPPPPKPSETLLTPDQADQVITAIAQPIATVLTEPPPQPAPAPAAPEVPPSFIPDPEPQQEIPPYETQQQQPETPAATAGGQPVTEPQGGPAAIEPAATGEAPGTPAGHEPPAAAAPGEPAISPAPADEREGPAAPPGAPAGAEGEVLEEPAPEEPPQPPTQEEINAEYDRKGKEALDKFRAGNKDAIYLGGFRNDADSVESFVHKTSRGYQVSMWDTDAGKPVGHTSVFRLPWQATERAKEIAGTGAVRVKPSEAEAPEETPAPPAAAPQPETAEATGATALADAVYQKLSAGESLGNVTELTKMAEQAWGASRTSGVWTVKDMFDAMEAGINRHLLDRGADLLAMDPHKALAELRELMTRVTSQGTRTDEQIKNQQFSTPPTEAYVAARVANLKPDDVVLEPSAGNGGLAVWPKSIGAETHVNEISKRRSQALRDNGFGDNLTHHDGELINALLDPKVKPTVVLMNPPFSASTTKSNVAPNRNRYGYNHVEQALQRLAPGGRLVAILGGGQANEPEGGASLTGGESGRFFGKIGSKYNIRANVRVSGKEYQKYGTNFATRIIVIDKTGGNPEWRSSVVTGNFTTLEEAYNALRNVADTRPQPVGPGRAPSTGERQPGTRLAPGADTGGERVPAEPGQGGKGPGGRGVSDEPRQPVREPGGSDTGTGNQPVPRVEPGPRPEATPENGPAEGSQGTSGQPDDQRTLGPSGDEKADRPVTPDEKPNPEPEPTVEDRVALENSEHQHVSDEEDNSPYVTYHPSIKGKPHPGDIVETKTMATVPTPKITYQPALPKDIIEGKGWLSNVQMEAIALAGQQNDIILPDGTRAAMLIGDGTGVGKGSEAAGIMWDNYRQGRRRLIWVSKNWDLMNAAIGDLHDVGAKDLLRGITKLPTGKFVTGKDAGVRALNDWDYGKPIEHNGIVFTTYGTLRAKDKKGNRRITQMEEWLKGKDDGEGAYILFDESHILKNAVPGGGRGKASQVGEAAKQLMERIPKLRSVSLSATAASDVSNLGYLDRLGIWGPGTAFPNGFRQFQAEVADGGLAAMELIARELKAQGKYVSRTLSFKGVEYDTITHKLTPEQKELYTSAANAWNLISSAAEQTIRTTTNGGPQQVGNMLGQFYSTQLRFYSVLLTTLKIPTAVRLANEALARGEAVTISVVNTNEAAQEREKNKAAMEGDDDEADVGELDFGPREILLNFIEKSYPTQQFVDDVDANGNVVKKPLERPDPVTGKMVPVQNPQAVEERNALMRQIERDLHLPDNPLDILINALGGHGKVAELTGRKEYYDRATGKFIKRAGEGVAQKDVNLVEMRKFQQGEKLVGVLSGAADTGISLHAGLNVKNQRRRYHITLQVGWQADKAMQMLGRVHRTNQAIAPFYAFVVSDLGGEQRFVATIQQRLQNLGALSKGQKDANASVGDKDFNPFSAEGRKALRGFYTALLRNQPVPGTGTTGLAIANALNVLKTNAAGAPYIPDEDQVNVPRLMNRVLGLNPDLQNAVFNYYTEFYQAAVQRAIEEGNLDTGVQSLPGDEFNVAVPELLATDPKTGAETWYYPVDAKVKVNRMSPEQLDGAMKAYKSDDPTIYVNKKGRVFLAITAQPRVTEEGKIYPSYYTAHPGNGNWRKIDQTTVHTSATELDKWAEKEATDAKTKLDDAKRELAWDEKHGYSRDKESYRKLRDEAIPRDQRYVDQKRADLAAAEKNYLDLKDAGTPEGDRLTLAQKRVETTRELLEHAEKQLATSRKQFEDMPDPWKQQREKVAELETAHAEAQKIASDPEKWAKEQWGRQYDVAPTHVTSRHHLIGGAVMKYWNALKKATYIRRSIYTTTDSKTKRRVVGIDVPDSQIQHIKARISGGGSMVDASQLLTDVRDNGLRYTLEGGIQAQKGRIGREAVLQLIPPNEQTGQALINLGVRYERGMAPIYYVPNGLLGSEKDGTKGTWDIIDDVLKQYPVEPERAPAAEDDDNDPHHGERGAATLGFLTLGLDKFISEDVAPTVRDAARGLAEAVDQFLTVAAPHARGEEAKRGGLSLRHRAAELARTTDQTMAAFAKAQKAMETLPQGAKYEFIKDMEAGNPQPTPELQQIADSLRALLDDRRNQVQNLGTGKLQTFYQDYFPHIWENPKKASTAFAALFRGKRPIEGSKAFLKKRKYLTFEDGLNAGLKPVTDNPVELALIKTREIDRFVMAHKLLKEWKKTGLAKFKRPGKKAPAGWRKITDPIGTVWGRSAQNELVVRGNYWAPEGAARILDNYLAPGLRAKSGVYRALLGANNVLNQAQLGLSAFHLGFTSLDAAISKGALALEQVLRGQPIAAARTAAGVPISPLTTWLRGRKVLQERLYPGSQNPDIQAITNELVKGGWRGTMDTAYATDFGQSMTRAFRKGNILGGLLRSPFAAVEALSNIIMKEIVPAQKAGVAADLARFEMERMGGGATLDQVRERMAQISDSVDNRLGQMVYDNQFWHPILKDISMLLVRSVGWNLGSLKEIGGAGIDTVRIPIQLASGRRTYAEVNLKRLTYVASLAILGAVAGAIYQYLATGKKPEELKDYYFPKNGQTDANGRPQRVALPSYVKDIYHYATEPGKTLTDKTSPLISLTSEMVRNQDFYGKEIRNQDDPLVQQMLDSAKHVAKAAEPFGVRNLEQAQEAGQPTAQKVLPFIGITPAPAALERSGAERLAADFARSNIPPGARTKEEARRREEEHNLARMVRQGKKIGPELAKALRSGTVTAAEARRAIATARMDPLAREFETLHIEQALKVWAKATPEERKKLRPWLLKKGQGLRAKSPAEQKVLLPEFLQAIRQ